MRLRTVALAAGLMAATVPLMTAPADAAWWGGGWRGGWGGWRGGWGWGGLGLGLAAGAVVGTALAATTPWYGWGWTAGVTAIHLMPMATAIPSGGAQVGVQVGARALPTGPASASPLVAKFSRRSGPSTGIAGSIGASSERIAVRSALLIGA
jgi:hypothetical protein